MKEPCRTCPERGQDFGGCRCQAFMLTGDAANADPVCSLSPHHDTVLDAVAAANEAAGSRSPIPLLFRNPRNARELAVTV